MNLQFAVSQASLIFQKKNPDAVTTFSQFPISLAAAGHLSATTNFWVHNIARLSYEKQGNKAAATNFRHVHFLCDLIAFF